MLRKKVGFERVSLSLATLAFLSRFACNSQKCCGLLVPRVESNPHDLAVNGF
jgi:hypothetical protein